MTFDETFNICNRHVEEDIVPSIDTLEDTLYECADSPEDCASPHYFVFVAMVHELMLRGWTIDELVSELKIHGPEAARMIDDMKRGLN